MPPSTRISPLTIKGFLSKTVERKGLDETDKFPNVRSIYYLFVIWCISNSTTNDSSFRRYLSSLRSVPTLWKLKKYKSLNIVRRSFSIMRLLPAKIGDTESVNSVGSERLTSIESLKSSSEFQPNLKGKDIIGGGGEPWSGGKRLGKGRRTTVDMLMMVFQRSRCVRLAAGWKERRGEREGTTLAVSLNKEMHFGCPHRGIECYLEICWCRMMPSIYECNPAFFGIGR